MRKKIVLKKKVSRETQALKFLEEQTKLPQPLLEEIMEKGALWHQKQNRGKLLRYRQKAGILQKGDWVEMYYDAKILASAAPEAVLLEEDTHWGVWYKPPQLLAQGTQYGDHASLLRQVEKRYGEAYLVHRLDREARGLMLVATDKKGASLLSQLWAIGQIRKTYLVEVLGFLSQDLLAKGEIHLPLDGKDAHTLFRLLQKKEETSLLLVSIPTGRLHQIRRHFALVGHSVMGDPVYGQGNKNTQGLMLVSYALEFIHPFHHTQTLYRVPDSLLGIDGLDNFSATF